MDPVAERFVENGAANAMLRCAPRPPYVVPERV
jgi:hypothetical protein